jgi:hypothetical protein
METVTRNVRDLKVGERSAVEQLVGHPLSDQQQLIIQVVGNSVGSQDKSEETDELPDWCNVYEGMSDDEITDIEKSIVRCDVSRSFE